MTKNVFISYASADRPTAERVRDDLEMDGIACWMAPRDVPAAGDYAKAITDAIGSCHVLLLLFSAAAAASDHVEREVHLAVSAKAAVVPLRLESIEPAGSLKYLLANVQRIDAFPRLEPQLSLLRSEIRRLLAAQGTVVASIQRSRFQHVLATAGAWVIVIGFQTLLLEWIHRVWFNLMPLWRVPVEAIRSPDLAAMLVSIPLVALALQYSAHRNLSRVATLDALFAMTGAVSARARLAGAAALYLGVAIAIVLAPPSVKVRLVEAAIDAGDGYVQAMTCLLPDTSYTSQVSTHYMVELRVASRNPHGEYALRTELEPYATTDGVEFCEVWLDRRLGVTTVTPRSDDKRSSGYIEVTGPLESFAERRSMLLSIRHYRDSEPSKGTMLRAILTRGSMQVNDDEPVALPLR